MNKGKEKTCFKCGARWISRTKTPVKCVRCSRRDWNKNK